MATSFTFNASGVGLDYVEVIDKNGVRFRITFDVHDGFVVTKVDAHSGGSIQVTPIVGNQIRVK